VASRATGLAAAILLAVPALARAAAPAPAGPGDRFPGAAAAYVVALDGRELWSRHPDRPLPPASLTKLMTALLALDGAGPEGKAWEPAAQVEVSPRAAAATGARLGLRAGERLRAADLLEATLVASSNDACLALAEHLAGSEPAFVARMNARAARLGLTATHFVNACGHDAAGHRASARDLLRLAAVALELPELQRLVALERDTITTEAGRVLELRTTNALLGRLEGARGVKTGFTARAGRCVVALVERGGARLLVVLLDASDRWWAAAGLVEKAFLEAGRGG
jgi:D-alanyl-D-alanine carboxypeptidase (penicillin-binding protein 5/6)